MSVCGWGYCGLMMPAFLLEYLPACYEYEIVGAMLESGFLEAAE